VAARGTPATALLAGEGIAYTVHRYQHDPRRGSYGTDAGDALGVPPADLVRAASAMVAVISRAGK